MFCYYIIENNLFRNLLETQSLNMFICFNEYMNQAFKKIFFLLDYCGDHIPSGCYLRRHVLQNSNNDGPSQNFLRHKDGDRIANQA